jgi:hypothetical protein
MQRNLNALSDKRIKFIFAPLLFCIGCIAVNFLFNKIITSIGLPVTLYLDTVGTVIAAVAGGTLPCVVVGFITNIILSISEPSSLYYGIINVLIAVAAAQFAERKKLKKPFGIIALTLVLTLIAGLFGTLIPWFMEGLTFNSESLSGTIYKTGYFNQFFSHLTANILINLIDKPVTVLIALVLYQMIPKKYRSVLSITGWRQTPLTSEEIKGDRSKIRSMSLRIKMLIPDIIFCPCIFSLV